MARVAVAAVVADAPFIRCFILYTFKKQRFVAASDHSFKQFTFDYCAHLHSETAAL